MVGGKSNKKQPIVSRKQRRKEERQAKKRKPPQQEPVVNVTSHKSKGKTQYLTDRKQHVVAKEPVVTKPPSVKSKPKTSLEMLELKMNPNQSGSSSAASASRDPLILKEEAEIEFLERKLGVRGKSGKKSSTALKRLSQEFAEDGFDGEFMSFLESLDRGVGEDSRAGHGNDEEDDLSGEDEDGDFDDYDEEGDEVFFDDDLEESDEGVVCDDDEEIDSDDVGYKVDDDSQEEEPPSVMTTKKENKKKRKPSFSEEEEELLAIDSTKKSINKKSKSAKETEQVDAKIKSKRTGTMKKKRVSFGENEVRYIEARKPKDLDDIGYIADDNEEGEDVDFDEGVGYEDEDNEEGDVDDEEGYFDDEYGEEEEDDEDDDDSDIEDDLDDSLEEEEEEEEDIRPSPKGGKKKVRKQNLDVDPMLAREEMEIAYLEKKLGLKKGKTNIDSLYHELEEHEFGGGFGSFLKEVDDLNASLERQRYSQIDEEDEEEDQDDQVSSSKKKNQRSDSKVIAVYDDEEDDYIENSDSNEDDREEVEGSSQGHHRSTSSKEDTPIDTKDTYSPALGEDIYGRPILAKGAQGTVSKYVPPARRNALADPLKEATNSAERVEMLTRLKRKVTGALNRLSEATLEHTARELLTLFDTKKVAYPTADITSVITEGVLKLCVNETRILKGVIGAGASLVVALHMLMKGPSEISFGRGAELFAASFVERLATDLKKEVEENGDNKWSSDAMNDATEGLTSRVPHNLVLLLAATYNLGLVQVQLVRGLSYYFASRLKDLDIELLLLLLKETHARLKSDDPSVLTQIFENVKAAKLAHSSNRIQFMEDELNQLKKSKKDVKKGAHHLDNDSLTRMRKLIQRLSSSSKSASSKSNNGSNSTGSGGTKLHMSWDDLIHAEEKGRWWRTGAAWNNEGEANLFSSSTQDASSANNTAHVQARLSGVSEELEKAAKILHMNTDARRAVFYAVMGADDIDSARLRLLDQSKLLKGKQGREIIKVILECCCAEASYNPYYAALVMRIIEDDPSHRFTLQLSLWDSFKKFDNMSNRRAVNMANFLSFLALHGIASLPSILKTLDLSTIATQQPASALLFATALWRSIISSHVEITDDLKNLCAKFGANKQTLIIRDQVEVFLSQHVAGPPKKFQEEQANHFMIRRKELVKYLRKANILYDSYMATKKSAKGGKIDDDIPDDEWAAFYTN